MIQGAFHYLLEFLAPVLLAHVLVCQQDLQQLLHGFLGRSLLLLFELSAANLTAERKHGHRGAKVAVADVRNTVDGDLSSGKV